jgi:hypothetical protein
MEGKHFLVKSKGKKNTAVPIKVLDSPEGLEVLSNPLGWKIYMEMASPSCPMDIAKKLGVHEQKVYYYTNKLKSSGLIREVKSEPRHGTIAKFYVIKDHALGIRVEGSEHTELHISNPSWNILLEPFVSEGVLDSKIIVGSPDPHGPWKARGSDSCCAIDFALFIGAFTNGENTPNYMLDTEVRDKDLRENLILFGGPTVNMVTKRLNDRLPIQIDTENNFDIKSKLSGKMYKDDEIGFIAIIDNPWKKGKKVLVLAGKRFPGTRSAVLAWVKSFEKVMRGNKFDRSVKASVVRGYDMSGDGVIDSAEILE